MPVFILRVHAMSDLLESAYEPDISAKKNRLGQIFLLLCGISILVFLAHTWRSKQPVAEISVKGNEALTPDEILKNINSSLRTQPVETVELASVKDEIEKNPLVKNAVVERRGIRGIEVKVQERIPVAAIISAEGAITFVDDEGMALPYNHFMNRSDVPLIRGVVLKGRVDTASLKGSMSILQYAGNTGDNVVLQAISEINYNPLARTYSISSNSGVEILLGTETILPTSLKKLNGLFKSRMIDKNAMRELKYIDLRWQGKVIARPRKVET